MTRTAAFTIVLCSILLFSVTGAGSQQSRALKNPYGAEPRVASEGEEIYRKNCKICHGAAGKGDICPDLRDETWKYGSTDADLFLSISRGRPGGMPNWQHILGEDAIWKVISYLRSIAKK